MGRGFAWGVPGPRRLALVLALGAAAVGLGGVAIVHAGFRRPSASTAVAAGHWEAVARGRAYLRQGRADLAFQSVSHIRDEAPGAGEAMAVAGLALLRYREYRGARLALERALKLQPRQLDATKTLAELNLMLGNGVRGVQLLEAAASLDPADAGVWRTMGKVLHDLGEPAKAARAFEEALKRAPRDRDALFGLITDLLNSNRLKDASPWVDEALRRFPDDPRFLGLAARHAQLADRGDEATQLAARALRGDPDNLNARLARARAQLASGHPQRALPDLEHAVAAHPNDLGALYLLAQVEARTGLTERAATTRRRHRQVSDRAVLMDELAQSIAQHPDDPMLRWRMGQTALDGGSLELASRCFQAALALDPGNQPARDSLAALRAAPRPRPAPYEAVSEAKPGEPAPSSR